MMVIYYCSNVGGGLEVVVVGGAKVRNLLSDGVGVHNFLFS